MEYMYIAPKQYMKSSAKMIHRAGKVFSFLGFNITAAHCYLAAFASDSDLSNAMLLVKVQKCLFKAKLYSSAIVKYSEFMNFSFEVLISEKDSDLEQLKALRDALHEQISWIFSITDDFIRKNEWVNGLSPGTEMNTPRIIRKMRKFKKMSDFVQTMLAEQCSLTKFSFIVDLMVANKER